MTFFGGKTIAEAFTAANTKAEVSVIQVNLLSMVDHACMIGTWFQDFANNFGIVVEHQQSMINAVTAIQAFILIPLPLPYFHDPRFPARDTVAVDAPAIDYGGNAVLILTMFDVVGWILSVVGVAPGEPTDDNKADYYYPLLTLYATICRTLLKVGVGVVSRKDMEASMMQVTWFEEGDVWRIALGAALDDPPRNVKSSAKNSRGLHMLLTGVINHEQYKAINLTWLSPSNTYEIRTRGAQAFGHCAETLPFTFVQWLRTSIRTTSIPGLATKPQVLLGNLNAVVYDANMRDKFLPPAIPTITAMQLPCKNCSMIVVAQFGGDEALDRFQIP